MERKRLGRSISWCIGLDCTVLYTVVSYVEGGRKKEGREEGRKRGGGYVYVHVPIYR